MKRKILQLPSWARVLPMMLLCLVVFAPFSIKAQCILPFGQVSPWQAKYFVEVGEAEPANDASGNTWKDLDYDDSSWGTLTGPMGTSGLQLFTPNFTINDEYTHFFLRRTFTIGDIADSYRLRLLNDDDLVVYLNGNYIIGNGNNIFYIEGAAFVQGTNVLSIYYKAQGVPNYLDYELCVNEDNVIQEDGTFTTLIENGIRMAFKVIDEEARTVQVGTGNASAIDPRTAGAITIPTAVNGYSVVSIGQDAFRGCPEITSAVVPEGVSEIKGGAFGSCGNLQAISLPTTLRTMGDAVFEGCVSLDNVIIPPGIVSIPWGLFMDCRGLSKFEIPNTVTTIGCYAFENCDNLKTVIIPNSVKSIGGMSFRGGLETVYCYIEDPFEIEDGTFYGWGDHTDATLYVPTGTIEKYRNTPHWDQFLNIREMGSEPISNYTDEQGLVYQLEDNNTYTIIDCSSTVVQNVVIPSTLFNTPVCSVGDNAFVECHNIVSIYVPASIIYWSWYSTYACDNLTSIIVADDNPVYDSRDNCNAIIHTATNLLVSGCQTTKIPSTVTTIDNEAFGGQHNLHKIVIPEGVTTLLNQCFESAGLKYIELPSTLKSMGYVPFAGCWELEEVVIHVDDPSQMELDENCLNDTYNATLFVPANSVELYRATTPWSNFSSILPIGYVNNDESVVFADTEVKRICIENWDTNKDGELSYAEAAAVTDLGQVFKINTIITSFEELVFFTGINEIPEHAFFGCEKLQSVSIPNQVTKIGHNSFWSSGLKSIYIPASVTEPMSQEFYDCTQLESIVVDPNNPKYDSRQNCNAIIETATNKLISGCMNTTIPNGVTTIGQSAFGVATELTQIKIPHSVTTIEYEAFTAAGLTSLVLPSSVQYLSGTNDFRGCAYLESIIVEEGNPKYDSRDNCNAIIETSTNKLVAGCKNTIIPESVTTIGQGAFDYIVGLESINLPSKLETIERRAFCNTGITTIDIPKSVSSIGNDAFLWCYDLNKVTVHWTNPISLDASIFPNRSYITLYVPYGCKSTYKATEVWKDFKEIIEMEMDADAPIDFADAEVKRICVENWDTNEDGELSYGEAAAVTDLGQVFNANKIITSFGELRFFSNIQSIPDRAFQLCNSLAYVLLPENLSKIGMYAFSDCNLTSVFIPKFVSDIGYAPFVSNTNLISIKVDKDNESFDSRDNCNAIIRTADNYLIQGCKTAFIPEGIIVIGQSAFEFVDISSIELPQSLQLIGRLAFYGIRNLESITFPEGLQQIYPYAFDGCTALTSVFIPANVTFISGDAFMHCYNITSVIVSENNINYDSRDNCNAVIKKSNDMLIFGCQNTVVPSSVKALGSQSFRGQTNLRELTLPEGITEISEYAFCSCTSLESINIPTTVSTIEDYAFYECSALASIVIPNSVVNIGKTAFMYCRSLTSVTIPKSVTSIGDYAFFWCLGLTSVTMENPTPVSIITDTFAGSYDATLYVPFGSKTAYETADVWKDFKEIVEVKPDNFLYANEATIQLGGKKAIALQLDNVKTLIAGEFRMQLPAGFSIEKDEDNNLVAELVGGRINNHTLEVRDEGNGLYHFLCYSGQNRPIKGNSGNFITFSLVADDAVEEGSYAVELKGIVFSDENEQRIELINSTFNITILDYTPGDVNDDGGLDVMDIVKMVSQIMGKNPADFLFAAADIDGNGKVNVMDLVNLVEMVMTVVNQAPASTGISQDAVIYSGLTLGKADDNTIALNVPDASNHIAAQFYITLSDNATLRDIVSDKAHQSRFTRLDDGRYWVMVYSNSNASFKNDSPISLQVNGSCNVKVEEVTFVDGDEHPVAFEPAALNTTGILAIGSYFDQPTDIYSVNGKLIKKATTSTIGLAKGVYVVNNEKVIIK